MDLKFHDVFYDTVWSGENRSHLESWKNKKNWADKILNLLDLGALEFHNGYMTCFDRCRIWN